VTPTGIEPHLAAIHNTYLTVLAVSSNIVVWITRRLVSMWEKEENVSYRNLMGQHDWKCALRRHSGDSKETKNSSKNSAFLLCSLPV
jgi:hypothetical protein